MPGSYIVVSAPAAVRATREEDAQDYKIVLRRVPVASLPRNHRCDRTILRAKLRKKGIRAPPANTGRTEFVNRKPIALVRCALGNKDNVVPAIVGCTGLACAGACGGPGSVDAFSPRYFTALVPPVIRRFCRDDVPWDRSNQ